VVGVGAIGSYTRSYGWLDASLGYRIDKRVTVSLEAGNILGTVRRSYYGTPTRPQNAWANDRQLALNMSVQF
jgi:outer membrane receptor protein involved in Fe transport